MQAWSYKSLELLKHCGEWLFTTLILISLLLNTCLSLDLYLTVKNPFAKASGRTISFMLVSLLIATVLMSSYILSFFNLFITVAVNEVQLLLVTFAIYAITAIATLISTMKRLLKPGFSREVRKTVVLRQVRYILTIVIFFLAFFVTKSLYFLDLFSLNSVTLVNFIGTALFCLLPMILSLYRLSEPLVWRSFKNVLRFIFCCGR